MPGGALRQVQNISTHATRKKGELKASKIISDESRQIGTETEGENVTRNLVDAEEKLENTKVPKTELLHEKTDIVEVAVQTDVIVSVESPNITAEDLRSPEASANYWRRLAERFYAESRRQAKINFELSIRLAKLNEEILEEENDHIALLNYVSAVDKEEDAEKVNEGESDGYVSENDAQ